MQQSSTQAKQHVEALIGCDKRPTKISGTLTKESVLALPVSSGSHPASLSSSEGLVPISRILVTIVAKVSHPKKKHDNKGKSTHQTKDKHRIEKMSSKLDVDDLLEIRHKYKISPLMGMMSVRHHLCVIDDPPIRWWLIHLVPFKI